MKFADEFTRDTPTYSLYIKHIGQYTLYIWAGNNAASVPARNNLEIDNYTSFEAQLFVKTNSVLGINLMSLDDRKTLGIDWSVYGVSACGHHGRFVPRAEIESTILKLQNAAGIKPIPTYKAEVRVNIPCKHCGRNVYEDDANCWFCETMNPGRK
jgi:hypothetical protein